MTSKKKIGTTLAKLALLISFLVQVGFFSQLSTPPKERSAEQKSQLVALERKMQTQADDNASVEAMQQTAKDYRQAVDPIEEQREKVFSTLRQITLREAASWLLNTYLYLLPWFAVLFLIWSLEESNKKKNFFKNPFSLIVSIIIYPIVILCLLIRWVRLTGRKVRVTTELRRTKEKFFSLLSEDESERIQQFVHSNLSVANWKSLLHSEGRSYHHHFVTALVVTVLFMIIGNPVLHDTKGCVMAQTGVIQITHISDDISPPDFPSNDTHFEHDMSYIIEWAEHKLETTRRLYIDLVTRCLDGFIMQLEHIPDSLTVYSLTNRISQLNIIRKIKNENRNCSSTNLYSRFIQRRNNKNSLRI